MRLIVRGSVWFGLYVALVLLPLALAIQAAPTGRSWWIEFGVALGFIAFTVMTFEFALVGRLRAAADPFGMDALMQFHRYMGVAAFAFVMVHVVIFALQPLSWAMLNPFAGSRAQQSGAIAFWALMILVLSSLLRQRVHLRYELWHWLHGLAAITIVMAALVHMLEVDRHLTNTTLRGLLIGYAILFVALMARYRLWRPLSLWRRPWQVVENRDEGGDTHTLVVRALNHEGLRFEPGQFVWLSTASHPFAIEQHPISIASSAEAPQRLELSIKALGDWSRRVVPKIPVGARVWLDGPYGAFTPERTPGQGFMLIAGGVGITPMRSILLTMRDRQDVRPVTLIYAAHSPQRMIFAEELLALQQALNLKCVFVYEVPPADWQGERGLVTTDLLRRYLPRHALRYQYFVCGPEPMMDAVESALRHVGIPDDRICTERFNMG